MTATAYEALLCETRPEVIETDEQYHAGNGATDGTGSQRRAQNCRRIPFNETSWGPG